MVSFFPPFPLHSWSTFLEIKPGTCWWMQVLFRNMTTCHHSVSCYQATSANICLACNIFCTVLTSKKEFVPFPSPILSTVCASYWTGSSSFKCWKISWWWRRTCKLWGWRRTAVWIQISQTVIVISQGRQLFLFPFDWYSSFWSLGLLRNW